MRSAILGMVLAMFVVGSAEAVPDEHYWSSVAAGCVPGDPAIQFDRYFITAGTVKHRAGGSGLVTLYCPVNPGSVWHYAFPHPDHPADTFYAPYCSNSKYFFKMTYSESDGMGTGASVDTQLIRISKANGGLSTITGALNKSNWTPDIYTTTMKQWITHAFDFKNNYYYVRVDLNRAAGSTALAILYGVALECQQ